MREEWELDHINRHIESLTYASARVDDITHICRKGLVALLVILSATKAIGGEIEAHECAEFEGARDALFQYFEEMDPVINDLAELRDSIGGAEAMVIDRAIYDLLENFGRLHNENIRALGQCRRAAE